MVALCGTFLCPQGTSGQTFDQRYSDWPEQLRIEGRILIEHRVNDFDNLQSLMRRVLSGKRVVVFSRPPESSGTEDGLAWEKVLRQSIDEGSGGSLLRVESQQLHHAIVEASIDLADVLIIRDIPVDNNQLAVLEPSFRRLIARGGTLQVDSRIAASLGVIDISGALERPITPQARVDVGQVNDDSAPAILDADSDKTRAADLVRPGMNLFLDCALLFGDAESIEDDRRIWQIMDHQLPTVGVIVEEGTIAVLEGRKVTCYGDGKVRFLLPAGTAASRRIESIEMRRSSRQPIESTMFDLTEWRRDAIDRTLEPFPESDPPTPEVPNGTLLIVGGGGTPAGLMDRFIELAGGPEHAKLVYVPCAEEEQVAPRQSMVQSWLRQGVKEATFIHTKDRHVANSDPTLLEPLRNATGIWFGGGRQWNFSDSYYGTEAHRLMKAVLDRGGVIAGSSAGASIQARFLARATPIGNHRIMAPGYQRGGLGFIGGVAIDQHFSQRNRQSDMTELMATYPQLLGIGIDESTAIEVQGSQARVSGRGDVYFYDRRQPLTADQPDYTIAAPGSIYDLKSRQIVSRP
jgi:cyanophycinase